MSERTQTYVFGLWTLIDEILNSVLFLLIGLEVLVLRFEPLALVARRGRDPDRAARPTGRRGAPPLAVRVDAA